MKKYFHYMCDFGHGWSKYSTERESDPKCTQGHEAVTCQEYLPADYLDICIRSATRLNNAINNPGNENKYLCKDRYYLVFRKIGKNEIIITCDFYTWSEAQDLVAKFKDLNYDNVIKRLNQKMIKWQIIVDE